MIYISITRNMLQLSFTPCKDNTDSDMPGSCHGPQLLSECTHKYKPTADTITPQPGGLPPIVTQANDDNAAPVKLVVVDGIVMGPKVRSL